MTSKKEALVDTMIAKSSKAALLGAIGSFNELTRKHSVAIKGNHNEFNLAIAKILLDLYRQGSEDTLDLIELLEGRL